MVASFLALALVAAAAGESTERPVLEGALKAEFRGAFIVNLAYNTGTLYPGNVAYYGVPAAVSQPQFVVSPANTIVGFKLGTDKIDLTAFHTDASHLALSSSGTSNTVYLEQTPGSFNPNTDLAMVVNATTTGGLKASDFVF